ncbi:DUF4129 domain-containing protein [Flagellimonas flava]|uniref:Protein-glutamine gamma-glutamyltransferase-like C-terminal domain-containing protein n=1 Tax=Flagellimonas flava TaxID=570519 RepID=A0A1M5P2F5_9FLAO|nr:DUF4129 domain-containing protein [Allomuricauda flava]SHG95897.1 protein of unknown function [Allomuricauda flava]
MRKIWLLGLLLLMCLKGIAQNDSLVKQDRSDFAPLEISKEDLRTYLEDDAFNYEIVKADNSWLDALQNWFYNLLIGFFEWLFGMEQAVGYLAVFLRFLPYILLAILLFLIIRFFIKANTRSLIYSQKNPNLVVLSEEERIIKTENIQELIQEALAQNNYRLAIRYYYLFILKMLTERELIDWQLQKTNDDYIRELSGNALKSSFSKATLLYDYIWYGEFNIDQERYTKAENVFVSLKNAIGSNV